jgi:hypothetical protein
MTTPASPTPSASSPERHWRVWRPSLPSDPAASNPWLKWGDQPAGFTLEGTWGGDFAGKYGPCAKLTRQDGTEVKFSLPTVLEQKVKGLPVGAFIRVHYLGVQAGQGERSYHDFDLLMDAASIPELADLPDDDEVPF